MLSRPCLNNPAFRKKNGPGDSGEHFANTTALSYLRASLAIIALLPDQPDLAWCYQVPQWWDLLHVLTQATVILLLHISIYPVLAKLKEISPPLESADSIWAAVQKGLSWLHCLGRTSEAARRAFQFLRSYAHRIAPSKNLELEGIPSTTESSQTSRDPRFPWLQDPPEGKAASRQQEIKAIDNPAYSKPKDTMLFEDLQGLQDSLLPSTSAVLDTNVNTPALVLSPNVSIKDILFAMVEVNR